MRVTNYDRSQAVAELTAISATRAAPTLVSDGNATNGAATLHIAFHDPTSLTSMTVQIWGMLADTAGALVAWVPILDANYTVTTDGGGTDLLDIRPYNRWYIEVSTLTGSGASVPVAYRVG